MAYALFIDQGLTDLANSLVEWDNPTLYLGLFTNNITPANTDVNATTTECVLTGYARIALNSLTWSNTSIANQGSYLSATAAFNFAVYGGGTTIYGFTLWDPNTNLVVAEGLLDSTFAVPAIGGTLDFTLEIACFANTGPFP